MFIFLVLVVLVVVLFCICFCAGYGGALRDFAAKDAEAKAKAEATARKEARAEKLAEARLLNAQAHLIDAKTMAGAAKNAAISGQDIPRACYTNGKGIITD